MSDARGQKVLRLARLPLGVGAACLAASGVQAAEWENSAGITQAGYYSDNICLDDEDHRGRFGGTIAPDFRVHGAGARGNIYLEAAVAYDPLADSGLDCSGGRGGLSNRETLIPSLRYRGDLEAIENWLTLESDAFIGRNAVDPFAPGGGEDFDGRDNTNITYQYGVGAAVERRLPNDLDFYLRYRYNEQFNEVNVFGTSTEDQVQFDLDMDPTYRRFSIGIGGHYSNVQYESTDTAPAFDNTLSSAEARGLFKLTDSWQINATAGEEWNQFTRTTDEVDGTFWDAGLRWSPHTRLEVSVGTGERFFGRTPRAHIRYNHKRSEITASYARTLTFPRNLRAASIAVEDPLDPVDDDFGQTPDTPPVFSGFPTFIGNSPLVDERIAVRYQFSANRTTIAVSGSDSRQTRLEDSSDARFSSIGFTFSRQLSGYTTGTAQLRWSEREGEGVSFGGFGQRSETWRLGLSLTRQLGIDTRLRVGYEYTTQDSAFGPNRYDENRITVSLRHEF